MQQLGPLGSRLTMDFCGKCWHVHSGTDPVSSKRPILQGVWQDCSQQAVEVVAPVVSDHDLFPSGGHPCCDLKLHRHILHCLWAVWSPCGPHLSSCALLGRTSIPVPCAAGFGKTAENTSKSCLAMTVPPFSGPISDHPKLVYLVSAQATWNCRAVESIGYLHYRPTCGCRTAGALHFRISNGI